MNSIESRTSFYFSGCSMWIACAFVLAAVLGAAIISLGSGKAARNTAIDFNSYKFKEIAKRGHYPRIVL